MLASQTLNLTGSATVGSSAERVLGCGIEGESGKLNVWHQMTAVLRFVVVNSGEVNFA